MVLLSQEFNLEKGIKKIRAEIKILNNKASVNENYTPVIHCKNIKQCARISKINAIVTENGSEKKEGTIRVNETADVIIEFKYRSVYIEINDEFFFLDGSTKGHGKVIEIL